MVHLWDETGTKVLSRSYFVYNSFKINLIPQHPLDISILYTKTIETNQNKIAYNS